jgi:D-glycero-D-manno-heptose 1,7-bisphosphate phosphatase
VSARRAAAFLDRDGTIIRDTGYINRAEDVELLPGAADAIRALNDAGVPVVVVSNQSGIGRGYLTVADYERVQARVTEALAASAGARLDASYACPHAPAADGSPACDCRKPGTLLFRQAAEEHGLDLARSWCVGDRWRDVAPALEVGARAALVPSASTPPDELALARARRIAVVPSLSAAARRIVREARAR